MMAQHNWQHYKYHNILIHMMMFGPQEMENPHAPVGNLNQIIIKSLRFAWTEWSKSSIQGSKAHLPLVLQQTAFCNELKFWTLLNLNLIPKPLTCGPLEPPQLSSPYDQYPLQWARGTNRNIFQP